MIENAIPQEKYYNSQIREIVQEDSNVRLRMNRSLPIYENKLDSPQYSPTASQGLNTLHKEQPFEIDKVWIREDFEANYNQDKREWFFSIFEKGKTKHFRKLFYQYLNKKEINMYFFYWFSNYAKNIEIPYHFTKISDFNPLEKKFYNMENHQQ